MIKTKKEEELTDNKNPSPINNISDWLKWLSERSWPLTCILLFISILFLYQFINYYKIPISISSPVFITSLPVIFGFLVFLLISIIGFFFSPAMILLTPITKAKNKTILETTDNTRILSAWLAFNLTSGSLIFLILKTIDDNFYYIPIIWPIIFLSTLSILCIASKTKPKDISIKFHMMTIASSFFYMIVFLTSYIIAINFTSEEYPYPKIIAISLLLPLIQLPIAKGYQTLIDSKNKIQNIAITSFTIIVFTSMQPYAAAQLTSKVLEFTATGHRSCAVIQLTEESPKTTFIRNPQTPSESLHLRIFIEVDGFYIVREETAPRNSAVHFIPRALVASMDSCPKETSTKKPKDEVIAPAPKVRPQYRNT